MKYWNLLRQLSFNAVFWVGLAAALISAVAGDFSLVLLFVALMAINFFLLLALKYLAPKLFSQMVDATNSRPTAQGGNSPYRSLGFRIYPLAYPKVLDSESREYVPELIHVDIRTEQGLIFNGNFQREALTQFRDALSGALGFRMQAVAPVSQPLPVTTTTNIVTPKKAVKKRSKKK